jgi:hypothetical protein
MYWPLFIILPTLCFAGAYGIQKRKAWAWYAGWVIAFFVAGAMAYYPIAMLFNSETTQQIIADVLFTVGGAAVWTFWAVWWATHREEFLKKGNDSTDRSDVAPG